MASSKEAFAKFVMWKKSRTLLKLILLPKGKEPETFIGFVSGTNEDLGELFFGVRETRALLPLDFSDASFRIGKKLVEAERPTGDLLTFEERSE